MPLERPSKSLSPVGREHKRQLKELVMQAQRTIAVIGIIPYASKDSILKRSLGPSSRTERALKALSMAGVSQPAAVDNFSGAG